MNVTPTRTPSSRLGGAILILSAFLATPSPATAAFPGQNGRIAYADFVDIHSVQPDGSDDVLLVHLSGSPAYAEWPSWSADGTRLAFHCFRNGYSGLCVLNSDATVSRLLKRRYEPRLIQLPSWSPDGTQIAFEGIGRFRDDVFIINADGTRLRRLTRGGIHNLSPAWSPDGTLIAFYRDARIATIRPDGTGLRVLSKPEFFGDWPEWSPDGAKIAWVHTNQFGTHGDIYVMNADGTDQTNLTNTDDVDEEGPFSWSPDGTKIAFPVSRAGGWAGIWVMDADGTGRVRITGLDTFAPDWQPRFQ